MNKAWIPTIGFLSAANYYDRNSWSGILFHMRRALKESGQKIVDLGTPHHATIFQRATGKVKKYLPWRVQDPRPGTPKYSERYESFARIVTEQLLQQPCDIIFAPAASAELMFIKTKLPVIYLSDVTFKLFCRHYSSDSTKEETDCLEYQEKTAIRKAAKLIYPSAWAACSAIEDYQASPSSIEIIPFGANLEEIPEGEALGSTKPAYPCCLLWVGRDWQRKGGQIAVEALLKLKNMGIFASLTVIGCIPPKNIPSEDITVITNIDKNRPEQKRLLQSSFNNSHFFIFPTRADCSPIVLCEAAAYGLPVLASDVGGISTIVENGKNGYLLPLEATGEDYANTIAKILEDPDRYSHLATSSRNSYKDRLNWAVWAEKFRAVVEKTLHPHH